MRNSLEKIVIALSKSNIVLKRVTLPQKYGERYTFVLYKDILFNRRYNDLFRLYNWIKTSYNLSYVSRFSEFGR
jgi:hypothetical protein